MASSRMTTQTTLFLIGSLIVFTTKIHGNMAFMLTGYVLMFVTYVYFLHEWFLFKKNYPFTWYYLFFITTLLIYPNMLSKISLYLFSKNDVLPLTFWLLSTILWGLSAFSSNFQVEHPGISMHYLMHGFVKWFGRIMLLLLFYHALFHKSFFLSPVLTEYSYAGSLVFSLLLSFSLDHSLDKEVLLLDFGDLKLSNDAHLASTVLSQTLSLAFLLLFHVLSQPFWKTVFIMYVIASVLVLLYQGKTLDLAPLITRVNGIDTTSIESLLANQDLETILTTNSFKLLDPQVLQDVLPEELHARIPLQVSTIYVPFKETILAITPKAKGVTINILPSTITKTLVKLRETNPHLSIPVSNVDITTLMQYKHDIFESLQLGLTHLLNSKAQFLKQLSEKIDNGKYMIHTSKDKTIVKLPGIHVIDNEAEKQVNVNLPFLSVVSKENVYDFVEVMGLQIFSYEPADKTLINGFIKIIDMNEWQYFNVLGIVKGIVNEKKEIQMIRILGVPINQGAPSDLDFDVIERHLNQRLSSFFHQIKTQVVLNQNDTILQIQDGKVNELPLPKFLQLKQQDVPASLLSSSPQQSLPELNAGDYEVLDE